MHKVKIGAGKMAQQVKSTFCASLFDLSSIPRTHIKARRDSVPPVISAYRELGGWELKDKKIVRKFSGQYTGQWQKQRLLINKEEGKN